MRGTRQGGFSLVEVVMAMSLLALLLFGLVATTAGAVQLTEVAQERRLALGKAEAVLNRLLADKGMPQNWSDAAGDPLLNKASSPPNAVPANPGPTNWKYDLVADLGETFPKELFQPSGFVTITSFQANPVLAWTPRQAGPPVVPTNFNWAMGHFFQVKVSISFLPAIKKRAATSDVKPVTVTAEAVYYRSPA